MSTLAERMQYVIDQKWVANAHAWSVAAKVTPQQVQTYLDRAANKPDADLMGSTLVALARAAKVSLEWLLTGEGVARGERAPRIVENYVGSRLRELRRTSGPLGKVASELGVDLAMIRRVWGGKTLGDVGRKVWPIALGFRSYDELSVAAREWWRTRGERLYAIVNAATDSDEERSEANASARSFDATDHDILAVLEANDGAGTQTAAWWLDRFMDQKRQREVDDRAWERDEKVEIAKSARRVRDKQALSRVAHDTKKPPKTPPASERKGRTETTR